MITITTQEQLELHSERIDTLYQKFGKTFQQSLQSLQICLQTRKIGDFVIFLGNSDNILTAFEKDGKTWQCAIQGFPILYSKQPSSKQLEDLLLFIEKHLDTDCLYFPLVYESFELTAKLLSIKKTNSWQRLPTQQILGKLDPEKTWMQVQKTYGGRANRQRAKFDKELTVKIVSSKDSNQVRNIISTIESNSWKRKAKQDMLSRGNQFEYYTGLINSGVAELSVAFKELIPVAFRIDSLVNHILYVIKWSYDENYKQYSPGFYLLAVDLIRRYKDKNLAYVDLYGSPDMLKEMIQNHSVNRFDFCYHYTTAMSDLKASRQEFDLKIQQNYINKQSIKKAYIL